MANLVTVLVTVTAVGVGGYAIISKDPNTKSTVIVIICVIITCLLIIALDVNIRFDELDGFAGDVSEPGTPYDDIHPAAPTFSKVGFDEKGNQQWQINDLRETPTVVSFKRRIGGPG